MPKYCCICGIKKQTIIGNLTTFNEIRDGVICQNCIKKMGYSTIPFLYQKTSSDLKKLYEDRNPLFETFSETREIGKKFRIDDDHKLFMLGQTIFRFDQLERYHVFEDGSTIITAQNGIGRAFVGQLLYGVGGAIVGAETAKRKSSDVCDLLQIKLEVKDYFDKTMDITFAMDVSKSSEIYKSAIVRLKKYTSAFDSIMGIKPQEEAQVSHGVLFSEADEIQKFRKLLDAGIITEEEFQAKKNQLMHI